MFPCILHVNVKFTVEKKMCKPRSLKHENHPL